MKIVESVFNFNVIALGAVVVCGLAVGAVAVIHVLGAIIVGAGAVSS